MRRLRGFLERAFDRATGYRLVPAWRLERFHQTLYLQRLLRYYQIDCVFDVGANEGQFREYLRHHVGYEGTIISFEPHPDCVARLIQAAAADPKWEIVAVALGPDEGEIDLNLMADSQYTSFLSPDNRKRPEISTTNRVVRSERVAMRRLDSEFQRLQQRLAFSRPFLKLDTQGFDLEVARSGDAVLKKFKLVQSEISNIAIYDGIPDIIECMNFYRTRGWQLSAMYPTNPEQFPLAVDFDAYFVSNDPAPD